MTNRTQGIIDKLASAESFEDVSWMLKSGVLTNYTESVIDSKMKANYEAQGGAGLSPRVERIPVGRTCEWCDKVAGIYQYPDVPRDVWRRHDRCNCMIQYTPRKGRTEVLTGDGKTWIETDQETLLERKETGLETVTAAEKQARKVIGTGNMETTIIERKAAEGTAEYTGKTEYAIYSENNGAKEAAETLANTYGGAVEYGADITHPGLMKWGRESVEYIQPGAAVDGIVKRWVNDADVFLVNITGTGEAPQAAANSVKKALNKYATSDKTIIIMRDGKIVDTYKFTI